MVSIDVIKHYSRTVSIDLVNMFGIDIRYNCKIVDGNAWSGCLMRI